MKRNVSQKSKVVSLVIGIIAIILPFANCKKEEANNSNNVNSKSSISGVVLFVVGNVQSGSKKIKPGDIISENESIQTGKNSACDLQIKESDSGIVMRMKSESSFVLKMMTVNGKQVPSTVVSIGSTLVNVTGKLKSGENFQVVTPTQTAGVRGTKFEVNVAKDGTTSLSVAEGKVVSRVRIAEADELPLEVQEKSVAISTIQKTLDAEEQVLEAGQKTVISKAQTDKILKETGLGDSIRQIQINSKVAPSSEDVNKAVATLDKQSPEPGKENPAVAKSLKENAKQKIEKSTNSDIQEKLKEFSELIAIEKQKLESESASSIVKQRNGKQEDVLIKRIEQITGKSFETLILKSGKKVRGVIFLENNIYYVVTPEGQETYKEEEADGIEL